MRLIGMLDSPYVRRVAISLELLGIPFTHESVSVFRHFDRFSALNPLVKAPTLITDSGLVLMESTLILDHLEKRAQPDRRLMPEDLDSHARCTRIIGLALAACEKTVSLVYEHMRPEEKQHQPWVERVTGQLAAAYDALEKELPEKGWLLGERPGQADLTAAVAWTFTRNAIPPTISLNAYPRVADFTARAEALPAFRAWRYA